VAGHAHARVIDHVWPGRGPRLQDPRQQARLASKTCQTKPLAVLRTQVTSGSRMGVSWLIAFPTSVRSTCQKKVRTNQSTALSTAPSQDAACARARQRGQRRSRRKGWVVVVVVVRWAMPASPRLAHKSPRKTILPACGWVPIDDTICTRVCIELHTPFVFGNWQRGKTTQTQKKGWRIGF